MMKDCEGFGGSYEELFKKLDILSLKAKERCDSNFQILEGLSQGRRYRPFSIIPEDKNHG